MNAELMSSHGQVLGYKDLVRLHIVRRLVLMSWGSCEHAEPWVEGGRGSDPHVGSPR